MIFKPRVNILDLVNDAMYFCATKDILNFRHKNITFQKKWPKKKTSVNRIDSSSEPPVTDWLWVYETL